MTDLRVVTLGELLEFKNGLNKARGYFGTGTPIVNFMDVLSHPVLTPSDVRGRVTLTPEEIRRFSAHKGDVFFTRTSESVEEVGTSAVLVDEIDDAVFSGFVLRGRPRRRGLDHLFLAYVLRSHDVRRQIVGAASYTTRALTNGGALSRVSVALPEFAEQHRIGRTLADVDELIVSLHRLIAKKQALRRGTAQRLLSGRTRLSGFSSPWTATTAGAVSTFKGGNGFPLRFQGHASGQFPFFKVSDMNTAGNERFMRVANNYISESVRKQLGATAFRQHAIVFAKVGAAVFLERKRILEAPSCIDNNMAAMLVNPARADYRFMHYALEAFRMSSLVATTALPSLNGGQLRSMPLYLPTDVKEQAAIAYVLSDADAEIDALKLRLDKAKAIKQGMAHQLLTGKARLPVREAVE